MREFPASIRRFLVDESGPTAVEYLVMMLVIIFVVVGGVGVIGRQAATWMKNNADALPRP